ncbi:MAG: D-alanine--D-alanine ligase family protein [Gemmatimonadota bacterium]
MSERSESDGKTSVIVLYNQVGEDAYEKIRQVDPATLGFEPEYPLDVATAKEEYEEIARGLRRAGYRARAYNLQNDLKRLDRVLKRSRPDVIFNLVEFFHDDAGLESAVAGVFELYRIPYTGAAPFTLELCQRKGLTKRVLEQHDVPTPRFEVLREPVAPKTLRLRFPVIVKPAWEDASSGVDEGAVVHDAKALRARLERLYDEFQQPLLVEEFIDGRELHVSVWGNADEVEVLPPIEFDFSDLPAGHPRLISYQAKWDPLSEVYHRIHTECPARLSKATLRRVEEVAIAAYRATGCRDYARLDMRLRRTKPYVLEVNPNPDLTESVSFMESAEVAGYAFPQALAEIVEMARARAPAPMPATPQMR